MLNKPYLDIQSIHKLTSSQLVNKMKDFILLIKFSNKIFRNYSAKLNFIYFFTQRRGDAENFSSKNFKKTLRFFVSTLKNKLALANAG